MRGIYAVLMVAVLLIGFTAHGGSLAGLLDSNSEGVIGQSFDQLRHFTLQDGKPAIEEYYADDNLEEALDPSLAVQQCNDSQYEYMATSPYYKVFFEGTVMRVIVQGTWVEFKLPEQNLGEMKSTTPFVDKNSLSLSDVFESVDLSYTVESFFLQEVLRLKQAKGINRIIVKISWGDVTPEFLEDGSILFVNENNNEILRILPPFMKDAEGTVCTDMHYELVETETGYELHKVIDEKGLE